ncbi:DEAD/DEAH box helicase-like protein [Herbaspirillum rubrisubalbicans M1]|nr:DEAD/DEAH box helicase-like protein [Herbaspirillum rubrisubalbicans M1]
MENRDQDRIAAAEQVRQELAIENRLSRSQARSYVRCLQITWQVPPIQWNDKESNAQLSDARRLLHAAHIFRSIQGAQSSGAIDCYRRAGEILEWLSRAADKIRSLVPTELLAAAAYQLGGLPAMASGLLKQVITEHEGVQLYASFLRADFDDVLLRAANYWRENPDLTTADADKVLATILRDEIEEDSQGGGVAWIFTVELVRTLGLIADCLRRGDDGRLKFGMRKLDALEAMANRTLSDDVALVISLMRDVAAGYVVTTIYTPLRLLAQIRPDQTDKLLAYGRDQYSRGRGILWASQLHGIEKLMQEDSFALCTPTGSGKTLVANMALVKELILRERGDELMPLALYIVPSRALASEVESKLTSELGKELTITGLYGGADWGITDYWLRSKQPVVLIATVEKAEALMHYLGDLLTMRLGLFIIDEAHQVVPADNEATQISFSDHSNRAIRLESLVSRILARRPEVVRIALTAVAGGAAGPVARWVEGRQEALPVGIRYRSTRQVIGILETAPNRPGHILLDLMNGLPLYMRGQEDPVYLPLRIEAMPPLPNAWNGSLNRFNCLSVLWTSLHLKEEDRRILISVTQQPEQIMRWYKEALQLDSWSTIAQFEPPQGVLRERFNEARATCLDYCGPASFELFLLEHGIASSHGQMPQRLRRLMVEMIERKICPITVATATLTEGVNLPFDLIFLTSLKRRSWDPVAEKQVITPLTTAEFRNLAGRAGRPGTAHGIEGLTLVALPAQISAATSSTQSVQLKQKAALAADYENLRKNLIEDETSAGSVSSPLAVLLARIENRALNLLGVTSASFLDWLEFTAPIMVSAQAGTGAGDEKSRLADMLDELDATLLISLEEIAHADGQEMTKSRAEQHLAKIWASTFTAVAAAREEWLEQAFIRRGTGIVEHIYPDKDERRRLYQYGFPPMIGRRFAPVAAQIKEILTRTTEYGIANASARIDVFEDIGDLLKLDRGFGFKVRPTNTDQAILENWANVLGWWMHEPNVPGPEPDQLRNWQRFVVDNIEFRMGIAIGAVVAQTWADGTADPKAIPNISEWKETTGLPWFGFWARELLRWGTHDPFVAFCLAQGLAQTRDAAASRRHEYESWLDNTRETRDSEDLIDPRLFSLWEKSLARPEKTVTPQLEVNATLTGTNGKRGQYAVFPISKGARIAWLDPAGFELATTNALPIKNHRRVAGSDYELRVEGGFAKIRRLFRPTKALM